MADRVKLTKRFIERDLPKVVTKETWFWDTEVLAFGIRMRPGARPAYAMRFKDDTYRGRKHTIGPVHQIDLDDARAIARQRFGEVAAGENPVEKAAARKRLSKTVSDLVEDVVEELKAKGRAANYVKDFSQQMRDHVEPILGNRLIRDVTATDVDRVLGKVANRAALHNRVRAGLSRLFTSALRGRYRTDNPVLGTTAQQEHPRERLPSNAEMDALLAALGRHPGQSSDAMRLLWLTGSRPQELFRSRWQDFDLVEGVWSKPAQFVKQKRMHRVTLQRAAVAVLLRMRSERPDEPSGAWVFPGTGKGGYLTTIKRHAAKMFAEAGLEDVRPYDLRKAFTSRLVASGADLKTIMSITGHTQINVLIKHYAHVMDGKQKEVLDMVFG